MQRQGALDGQLGGLPRLEAVLDVRLCAAYPGLCKGLCGLPLRTRKLRRQQGSVKVARQVTAGQTATGC